MKQNIYDNPTFFNEYKKLRESGITYNDFIEQPAVKSAISCLEGKTVLDLGCGTGEFVRYCLENKASYVLGVDISKKMIEQAKIKTENGKADFICAPIEDINITDQKFDVIISSLAIHYIEDYDGLINKVRNLLNYDGVFIFSTEHPIVTARKEMDNWIKDGEGNKLYWALDDYHEEGKREQHWYIEGVIKYHRTISTLVNTLITNGFKIEEIQEPQSTSEGLNKMPKLVNEKRRPSFIVIKAQKSCVT
ncbi:Methyltransferase domain-containing protein [Oceanobacillus limi]|uniref:Methyltransferase domain-containing protein n=1 Tax=Oceanobacillus limi TaxID=930131 RepID=A0A1H9ZBA2_9BACI|nr:class I SAM-dependent methyltransferase [Oceanobacillus limi]SES78840.1 Methyltransferase domain-containing protein [Oceanobacillus limi]